MRVATMVKRLAAGTFVAAALIVTAPGLAGASPAATPSTGSSHTVKSPLKGIGHIIAPAIWVLNPNGPGWDGQF